MMLPMNQKLENVMKDTNELEKIRLFYELAKYFLEHSEDIDEELEDLYDDIANIVSDIESL